MAKNNSNATKNSSNASNQKQTKAKAEKNCQG